MAKVMISMPDELLKRVDARAKERHTTRSGLLRDAAQRELERPTPEQVRAAMREGQGLLADLDPFDSTAWIRADRDARDARH